MKVARPAGWVLGLVMCASLAPAAARADGRLPRSGERPPPIAGTLTAGGTLCLADSAYFRVWWQDRPGAPGALAGADGSCATLPPAATETLTAAEQDLAGYVARGFARIVGDAPPRFAGTAAAGTRLARLRPALRARSLARLGPITRGRLLAGLTAAQRRAVLRGLPRPMVRRMNAELRAALKGRPADFIGGDRRLDLVLDATGASGLPRNLAGAASCSPLATAQGRRYVSGNVIVLTPDPTAPRATLAHELFHVVQCNALVATRDTDLLFLEGTAELYSSYLEPAAFTGAIVDQGDGTALVTEGAGRAAGFCGEFVPSRESGTDPYNSWPVWDELERAAPGTIRALMGVAATGRLADSASVIATVGPERWSAALVAAVQSVCGNLRAPSGHIAFSTDLRRFIGAQGPRSTPGAPASVTVAPGGAGSVAVLWTAPATAVTVRATSAATAPALLVAQTVAVTGGGPVPATADATSAVVSVPAPALASGLAMLTFANPSATLPMGVTVEVVAA